MDSSDKRFCTGENLMMPLAVPTHGSILEQIGDTPLIELRAIVPEGSARVFVKAESENPTGSLKDRMALAMIETAEKDGRLKSGQAVVEYTGGSTGTSLAMVCAAKGYPLHIVTSDAFSTEKRDHMKALGAELTVIESDFGGMDEALTRNMIETARQIRERTGGFWTDQLNNRAPIGAYRVMGDEIWRQTGGRIDAFVQGVGTSASLRGAAESLLDKNKDIHIVAMEPSESAVLSGRETGVHKIEGIGAGYVVPLWDPSVVDEIATVSTEDAKAMARRMAREEALFAGTSTGGNVVVALRLAEQLGPDASIVALMCDSGIKYLSTDLYREG